MKSSIQVYTDEKQLGSRSIFSVLSEFLNDLKEAFSLSAYSVLSASYEIKARYATSVLGPMWMVMSNMIFVAVISLIYSTAFGIEMSEYVPFLASGYLLWLLLVGVIQDGSATFLWYGGLLRNNKISPLLIYGRIFSRATIIFAHNVPLIFAIVFYYKGFDIRFTELILGFCIYLTCTFFLGLIFSILACRFRDVLYVLPSVFQVLLLMMPILWKPDMLAGRKAWLLEINVVYQLLEIVRAPILGASVPEHYYISCLILTVLSFLCAAYLYVGSKNKIVLWS